MAPWGLSNKSLRTVLICYSVSFFCGFFVTVLISTLPVFQKSFGCDFADTLWLSATMPIAGVMFALVSIDIADKFGKRNCTVYGLAVVAISSILSLMAGNIFILILTRIIAGLGNALIFTPNNSIITDCVEKKYLPEALAFNYALSCIGGAVGPLIGFLLADNLGWQSIFLLIAPLSVVFIFAMYAVDNNIVDSERKIDVMPHIVFILSAGLILNSIFMDWKYLYLFGIGIVIMAVLIYVQTKSEKRILDISMFRNRLFTISTIAGLLFMFSVYCVDDTVVLHLQEIDVEIVFFGAVLSLTFLAALLRGAKPILQCILSPVVAKMNRGHSPMKLTFIGFAIVIIAPILFILNRLVSDVNTRILMLIVIYVILAVAAAVFNPQNRSIIMSTVEPHQRNSASSVLCIVENLGRCIGIIITSFVLCAIDMSGEEAYSFSTLIAIIIVIFACAIGLIITSRRRRNYTDY